MSTGKQKRKVRGSEHKNSAPENKAENNAPLSDINSDLESGEIAQESDMELEDSFEGEEAEKVRRGSTVDSDGMEVEVEVEGLGNDDTMTSKTRKESKKSHREDYNEIRRTEKRDKHRFNGDFEDSRRRRHRRHSPSAQRSVFDRYSSLSYRERERLRKKEDFSPRRHRVMDHRLESSRYHREEKEHRRHSKRHKRRHQEKDRHDVQHLEEDLIMKEQDEGGEEEKQESQLDESTVIEKQREERRQRMEAIKNKHRQKAEKQTHEGTENTGQDSDCASGKSTNDVQPNVVPSGSGDGNGHVHVHVHDHDHVGVSTPESVSSTDYTLFNRKIEDTKVVEQVSSVFPVTDPQLTAIAEVEIDKNVQNMEKDECSTDPLKLLEDEKHDKEKLLVDTQNTEQEQTNVPSETDDIFCESPEGGNKDYSGLDNAVRKAAANRGLIDAYDDSEGYYKFRIGEIIDSRYEISSCKGKGVFSTVLRGKDKVRKDANGEYPEVCIKVIRANDLMKNCGKKEEQFLKQLASTDPENKRHCVRLLRSFIYRGHLCLVFEPMAMNLRELTHKFGRDVGLSLDGVGHFTAQLLVALKHLKTNKILHADIKPDNILVNEKFSRVKLCDFGSAMEDWSTEITPYVCSRFYRPPEVILGLEYSYGMDMWSLGCVIYEMFTGQYLFPGRTNNAMLRFMMDVKGPFPRKLLKKASFCEDHFEKDANMSFIEIEIDKFSKKQVRKLVSNPTVKNNFQTLLAKFSGGCDHRLVSQLADLLEKMMMLDPDKRVDVDEAMRHPFVKTFLHKAKNAQHLKEQQEQAAQQKAALKSS